MACARSNEDGAGAESTLGGYAIFLLSKFFKGDVVVVLRRRIEAMFARVVFEYLKVGGGEGMKNFL